MLGYQKDMTDWATTEKTCTPPTSGQFSTAGHVSMQSTDDQQFQESQNQH